MPGKKSTPQGVARDRRERWRRAVKHSGLSPEEVSAVVGKSLGTVYSYNYRDGNVPTEAAIEALRQHNLHRAVEVVRERYGDEALSVGPRA